MYYLISNSYIVILLFLYILHSNLIQTPLHIISNLNILHIKVIIAILNRYINYFYLYRVQNTDSKGDNRTNKEIS